MSNTCGEIRFMEGGTIKDATIVSSNIVNSSISSSNLDSSTITNLSSIDSASAKVIMQAIANLSPSDLRILIDALLAAVVSGGFPSVGECQNGSMPASILGDNDYVLGKPTGWLVLANGGVPVYGYPCGGGSSPNH